MGLPNWAGRALTTEPVPKQAGHLSSIQSDFDSFSLIVGSTHLSSSSSSSESIGGLTGSPTMFPLSSASGSWALSCV